MIPRSSPLESSPFVSSKSLPGVSSRKVLDKVSQKGLPGLSPGFYSYIPPRVPSDPGILTGFSSETATEILFETGASSGVYSEFVFLRFTKDSWSSSGIFPGGFCLWIFFSEIPH